MKKKFFNLMAAVLAAGVLSGCASGSDNAQDTYKVSIAVASNGNGMSFYKAIADANNLGEGLDLDIEWIEGLTTGPEIIAAITGGSLNLGSFADFPVITGYGSDQEPAFTVVGYAENITDSCLFVKADSDIQSLADLKGHKVGLQVGTGSQYQTQVSLAKAGLTIDDIEMVNLDVGSWVSAFVGDEVDAVCIQKLVTIDNEQMGEIRILDEADYALNSLIANTEWAEKNPETVARVLILLHRVLEFYTENKETAVQNVLDVYPEVSRERASWTLEALSDTYLTLIGDEPVERYTELKEFALEAGIIEKDFDVNDVYDNSYIELANELMKELE